MNFQNQTVTTLIIKSNIKNSTKPIQNSNI